MSNTRIGIIVLRLGLAAVFIWFGSSQLLSPSEWVGWVPKWAENLSRLSAEKIVFINGIFELVLGLLLVLGFKVRLAASFLALHLAVITFDIGWNEIGVRDFGLTLSTLALAIMGGGWKR